MKRLGATLAAGVVLALAAPVRADTPPYVPAQASIENACNALAKDPPGTKKVYLARLRSSDGSDGSWQRSDDKTNARVETGTLGTGDVVTVRQGNAMLLAILTSASTGAATTRAWCYLGGQLSRADIALPDPETRVVLRRAQFFEGDVDKPTYDIVYTNRTDLQYAAPAKPSTDKLPIEPYATPSKLPFYDAYKAALAGTLPRFKPPGT